MDHIRHQWRFHRRQKASQRLRSLLIALGLHLVMVANSEEKSILDGASVQITNSGHNDVDQAESAGSNALIDGNFKTYQKSKTVSYPEFIIDFTKEEYVMGFFLMNTQGPAQQSDNGYWKLYHGSYSCGSYYMSDSGFQTCSTVGDYDYVKIRRSKSGSDSLQINELRVYQTKNLIEYQSTSVSISAPAPKSTGYEATNLITNLGERSAVSTLSPLTYSYSSSSRSTKQSCYSTTNSQLSSLGDQLVITVDLGSSLFQHCILIVQDLMAQETLHHEHTNQNEFVQNFQIHIGDDANYANNPQCPGGPFMRTDDTANSFTTVSSYTANGSTYTDASFWNYGKEIWCNMQGQYTTIVADLSSLSGQAYEMSICHLGIFGTKYTRTSAAETAVYVSNSSPSPDKVLNWVHISASISIKNILMIKLRQKAGHVLSWIIIEDQLSDHKITIQSANAPLGVHTAIFESYDDNSTVKSVLKTDTLTITVIDCSLVTLSHPLTTDSTISVIREYQPTINFPDILFTPSNQVDGDFCWGTSYDQNIVSSPSDISQVKTDYLVPITASTPAQTYQLTFGSSYRGAFTSFTKYASEVVEYNVRTIMHTDFLQQPVLTPSSQSFNLAPGAQGSQTVSGSSISVRYPFKSSLASDSQGKSPPAVSPDPFTGFSSSTITYGLASLGTTDLDSPVGTLASTTGDQITSGHSLTFACPDWILDKMDTTETYSVTYTNSVYSTFTANIPFTCNYQTSTPPTFLSSQPTVILEPGLAQEWALPDIDVGSLPFQTVRFEPAKPIAPYLALTQPSGGAVGKITYDGSQAVVSALEVASEFTITLTIVNTFGQESVSYTVNFRFACNAKASDLAVVQQNLFPLQTLAISTYSERDIFQEESFQDIYDVVVRTISFDADMRDKCGDITFVLTTTRSELTLDSATKLLKLQSSEATAETTFSDSRLKIIFRTYEWPITVQASFVRCQLTSLGFEQGEINVEYQIGSGQIRVTLPKVKQEPDCGFIFDKVALREIVSQVPLEQISTAVSFDLSNEVVTIDTVDFSFAGSEATVKIKIEQEEYAAADDYLVNIQFGAEPASFVMSEFSVEPLTCSQKDSSWALLLPSVTTLDVSPVSVKLISSSDYADLFVLNEDIVTIDSSALSELESGQLCPKEATIKLRFMLKSDLLGENEQSLIVPVDQPEASNNSTDSATFAGVVIDDSQPDQEDRNQRNGTEVAIFTPPENPEPLEISRIKLSPQGELKIKFSKPILLPLPFKKSDDVKKGRRNLGDLAWVDLADVIKLEIDDEEKELDKSISKIDFVGATEREVTLLVTFSDTKAISQEVREPDILNVNIAMLGVFVDADTGTQLDKVAINYNLPIGQQFTKEEYKQLEEQAQKAAQISVAVSIWQLIIILAFKKVLFSMWTLILTLQFFVYLATWQVRYPSTLNNLLYQLKRIALGEFMDDFDIGNDLMKVMGLPPNEASATEEKVGEERLGGSSNALSSLGATLLLGSLVFVLIIIMLVAVIVISRRVKFSDKCRERVKKLKQKVFYNPIIRYLLLNSLKLNMSGLIVFKTAGATKEDIAVAVAIIALVNGAPLMFLFAINRNRGILLEDDTRKSFGAAYAGKNVTDEDHAAHVYPFVFFLRRCAFIAATIYLFDYPVMQMNVQYLLTMVSICILANDSRVFESKSQRIVEIGSDLSMHFTCIMLCQFMSASGSNSEQLELMEKMTLGSFGVLLSLNVLFILFVTIRDCKAKKRKKAWEKRKLAYEEAQTEKNKAIEVKQKKIMLLDVIPEDPAESERSWKKRRALKRQQRIKAKKEQKSAQLNISDLAYQPGMPDQQPVASQRLLSNPIGSRKTASLADFKQVADDGSSLFSHSDIQVYPGMRQAQGGSSLFSQSDLSVNLGIEKGQESSLFNSQSDAAPPLEPSKESSLFHSDESIEKLHNRLYGNSTHRISSQKPAQIELSAENLDAAEQEPSFEAIERQFEEIVSSDQKTTDKKSTATNIFDYSPKKIDYSEGKAELSGANLRNTESRQDNSSDFSKN